jgi:hypothetical protein
LDRKRLLGEHRELHGLFNVISMGKKGYSGHPETLRWVDRLPALCLRHHLLVSEMLLRGYQHHSPLPNPSEDIVWPDIWINTAGEQFALLADKQSQEDSARIPLPVNTQQLWAQHKYSVMAHDPALYSEIGPEVTHGLYRNDMETLAELLVNSLRQRPSLGHLHNALHHMWGHVSDGGIPVPDDLRALMTLIQQQVILRKENYLLNSTALSELYAWSGPEESHE